MNINSVNEQAVETVKKILTEAINFTDETEEEFVGTVYGYMVAAVALGWDVETMIAEAVIAGDKLIALSAEQTE